MLMKRVLKFYKKEIKKLSGEAFNKNHKLEEQGTVSNEHEEEEDEEEYEGEFRCRFEESEEESDTEEEENVQHNTTWYEIAQKVKEMYGKNEDNNIDNINDIEASSKEMDEQKLSEPLQEQVMTPFTAYDDEVESDDIVADLELREFLGNGEYCHLGSRKKTTYVSLKNFLLTTNDKDEDSTCLLKNNYIEEYLNKELDEIDALAFDILAVLSVDNDVEDKSGLITDEFYQSAIPERRLNEKGELIALALFEINCIVADTSCSFVSLNSNILGSKFSEVDETESLTLGITLGICAKLHVELIQLNYELETSNKERVEMSNMESSSDFILESEEKMSAEFSFYDDAIASENTIKISKTQNSEVSEKIMLNSSYHSQKLHERSESRNEVETYHEKVENSELRLSIIQENDDGKEIVEKEIENTPETSSPSEFSESVCSEETSPLSELSEPVNISSSKEETLEMTNDVEYELDTKTDDGNRSIESLYEDDMAVHCSISFNSKWTDMRFDLEENKTCMNDFYTLELSGIHETNTAITPKTVSRSISLLGSFRRCFFGATQG